MMAVAACAKEGEEGDEDAALHVALVGQQIRRDDDLAVARADGVENAIGKGKRRERPGGSQRMLEVHGAESFRHAPIIGLLNRHRVAQEAAEGNPAGPGRGRIRCGGRSGWRRHAERLGGFRRMWREPQHENQTEKPCEAERVRVMTAHCRPHGQTNVAVVAK